MITIEKLKLSTVLVKISLSGIKKGKKQIIIKNWKKIKDWSSDENKNEKHNYH